MYLLVDAQLALLALILATAATTKLALRNIIESTSSVFLLGRLSPWARRTTWYSLALLEGALAIALLTVPGRAPRLTAVCLFVGMSLFALTATRVAPESTCGCFGAGTRVSWRTAVRSALLAFISASSLIGAGRTLPNSAVVVTAVLLLEGGALAWLSLPADPVAAARHLRYRLWTPGCLTNNEPLDATVRRLRRSKAWELLAAHIAEPESPHLADHWREGCWRFLAFAARDADAAQVVFAVHLPPGPASISGALVLADGTTAATAASRESRWHHVGRVPLPIAQLSPARDGALE